MSKRLLFLGMSMAMLIALPGCWPWESKKQTGLVVINVLDSDLHSDCHIKGSINIPMDAIDTLVQMVDKEAEIVVYCSNYLCTSSAFARARLKELGFKTVYAYEAGIAEWYSKGLPVEGKCQQDYLKQSMHLSAEGQEGGGIITTDKLASKMGMSGGTVRLS